MRVCCADYASRHHRRARQRDYKQTLRAASDEHVYVGVYMCYSTLRLLTCTVCDAKHVELVLWDSHCWGLHREANGRAVYGFSARESIILPKASALRDIVGQSAWNVPND